MSIFALVERKTSVNTNSASALFQQINRTAIAFKENITNDSGSFAKNSEFALTLSLLFTACCTSKQATTLL